MDDEPVGSQSVGQSSKENAPHVPIKSEGPKEEKTADENPQHRDVGRNSVQKNTRKRNLRAYFLKLRRAGPDRHIELLLAAAIALFAALQLAVTVLNNYSTSKQVDKIIKAANDIGTASGQIQGAANQFAGSAEGINRGIADAVDRLNDQATKLGDVSAHTGDLATDTKTANSNVIAADRPWMGGFLQSVTDFDADKKPSFTIVFTNSGRRPARITFSAARENWYRSFPPNPDSEYILNGEEPSTNIVVPGQPVTMSNTADTPIGDAAWQLAQGPNPALIYFVFAKVEYADLRTNEKHWTHICFRFYPKFKTDKDWGFRNCKEYNDAN